MQTKHPYLTIFLTFLKIGVFTFGGGYAMISLIEREFVAVRKWISAEEMMDMIAISESTPGPLAINSATYVGYRLKGFWGALLATVAVTIPSFLIIFCISLFLDRFLALRVVANAFKGIQVAVGVLILIAGLNMFRQMEKNALSIFVFVATFVVMIGIDAFAWRFSVIWLILIGGALGLTVYGVTVLRARKKRHAAGDTLAKSARTLADETPSAGGETPASAETDALFRHDAETDSAEPFTKTSHSESADAGADSSADTPTAERDRAKAAGSGTRAKERRASARGEKKR